MLKWWVRRACCSQLRGGGTCLARLTLNLRRPRIFCRRPAMGPKLQNFSSTWNDRGTLAWQIIFRTRSLIKLHFEILDLSSLRPDDPSAGYACQPFSASGATRLPTLGSRQRTLAAGCRPTLALSVLIRQIMRRRRLIHLHDMRRRVLELHRADLDLTDSRRSDGCARG